MEWLWPGFFLLLGLIPLMIVFYIWILRRRRRYAVHYSSLALVRVALPQQSRWRRHIPFFLFLLGLSSLVLAVSRPVTVTEVPSGKTIIILALDVSRSMCSTDISPYRLKAAEDAALSFIRSQSPATQIGIVAFAGFAELIQPPTDDQIALETAIKSLTTARRTAIGSGILRSLDAIAEVDESITPSSSSSSDSQVIPLPEGVKVPHIIVLLTDGANNTGPTPLDSAQQAAARGVRVYAIGFGTEQGGSFGNCGQAAGDRNFFGGGGQGFGQGFGPGFGPGFLRGIDEEALMQVADVTDGKYYSATSANQLNDVFRRLPVVLLTRHETLEISVVFTAIGALLTVIAIMLSQIWHTVN